MAAHMGMLRMPNTGDTELFETVVKNHAEIYFANTLLVLPVNIT